MPVIPVPLTAKSTVWSPVTAPVAVAVTVMTVPAASVPKVAETLRLTSGSSSSVVLTITVWFDNGSKASSLAASLMERVIPVFRVPSKRASSTPVTVIVCGVFQLAAVKVRLAGLTVASPVSPLDTSITTSEAGCAFRTMVNPSVVPVSDTVVFPPL